MTNYHEIQRGQASCPKLLVKHGLKLLLLNSLTAVETLKGLHR